MGISDQTEADCVIIGAGLYGLYAALYCARKKAGKILVLECDQEPFSRATYINQARVHMGYHYPRSLSTAEKSAHYFKRFSEEYEFCIHGNFEQIYAISSSFSWTDAGQFEKFCRNAGIPCEKLDQKNYFNAGCVEEAYKTQEYTYDAVLLRDYFLTCLAAYPSVQILCRTKIDSIWKEQEKFCISCQNGKTFVTAFLLNAAYAAANMISDMARMDLFKLKYELCEIILCKADEKLRDKGITVMDGPFFSIMPFGKTGYHSLTSVTFTPHETSFSKMPEFSCQKSGRRDLECGDRHRLGNCNLCDQKPESAWDYMAGLAEKYLRPEFGFAYEKSLFSVKPVLASAEIDDSRPTVIRVLSKNPVYIAVLSGKINTVYDLDEVLDQEI